MSVEKMDLEIGNKDGSILKGIVFVKAITSQIPQLSG